MVYLSNKVLVSLFVIILLLTSSLILIKDNSFVWYLLAVCDVLAIICSLFFVNLRKFGKVIIVNFSSIGSKIIQNTILPISILLSIYIIPIEYFYLSIIIMLLSIVTSIAIQRLLVIKDNELCYIMHWTLKWDDIDSCCFSKQSRILRIKLKNGDNKQILGVSNRHYAIIKDSIEKKLY